MGKVNIKQLNVAPASGYVIGSGVGGVPVWKLEVASVDWNQITGNQALVNLSGFTNDSGFITLGSLSAGTGISYDNLTGVITNSSPASNITASQGLTRTVDDIALGGSYTTNREILRADDARVRISDEAARVKTSEIFNVTIIHNTTSAAYTYQNAGNLTTRTYLRFGGTNQSFSAATSPTTFGRLMFSGNTTEIDRQGSSGADFPMKTVLAAYYANINPTNIGSSTTLYPDLLLYGGTVFPALSGANKIVGSITMFGARAYNVNETATINSIYGATIGFHPTTNRKGATRNIGFGVYFSSVTSTTNGQSQNSIMDDYVEQTGDFAFYDQTGWNNYFKGALGLGNPIPVSKLDVTGDINTTVGFKISGAATLGNYLRGNGTNFVSSALTASDLPVNSITDGLIRQSAGLSVIGRSANSTGNVADITAGTDGFVLRRSGTTLAFGLVPLSSVSATNGRLVYAAGGVLAQSANLTYSGTTLQNTGGGFIIGDLVGSTAAGSGILMQRGSLNAGLFSDGTLAIFGAVTAHAVSLRVSNTAVITLGTDLSVMIGTTTANNGVVLNVNSATKAMYIPRLTTAAVNAVASPSVGMIAADTDMNKIRFHNGSGWQIVALEGVGYARNINTQTIAYQPVLTDLSKVVTISNASPVDFTVPLNSTIAFPVGSQIDIIQLGAGQVTVVGAGGVTVNSSNGLKLRAQYSSATLIKLATDTWVLVGDTDI